MFAESRIAFALWQADEGTPVAEICRKMGIAEHTFYNRQKKYWGLLPNEVKKLR